MSERNVKGLLGTKLGMTQVWDAANKVVPVTVILAGPCVVTQVRTPDADGYSAVQLGFGAVKAKNVTKPDAGHFERAGVTPRKHLVELRTGDARGAPQAPFPGFDRRLRHSRARVQGHQDGRPHGRREGDRAEPHHPCR